MIKFILFMLLPVFILSCQSEQKKQDESEGTAESIAIAPENLIETEFTVHGMTCTGCEETVQESVASLEGIKEVKASHLGSVAKVSYDKTKTTPEEIAGAIEKVGYTVIEDVRLKM